MTLGRIAAATLSRIDTPPYSPDKSNMETSALLCSSLSFLSRVSFASPRLYRSWPLPPVTTLSVFTLLFLAGKFSSTLEAC